MAIESQMLKTSREVDRLLRAAIGDMAKTIRKYRMSHGMVNEFEAVKPMLRKQLMAVRRELHDEILRVLESGSTEAWMRANRENNVLAKAYLKDVGAPASMVSSFTQVNMGALEAFINRKEAGMNLSERVWRLVDESIEKRIETYIGAGITTGKSAARMAVDLKQYLNKPDALFRRVRNADGKLVWSKAAKAYHPGQGVYRSASKNARRLARTETNIAYQLADSERRQQMPFVTGIEVHANPDCCDMCASMAGEYPPGFVFTAWHPHCRCWTTDKLLPKDEFKRYLDGAEILPQYYVNDIPVSASTYLQDNAKRFSRTKKTLEQGDGFSYWMQNFTQKMTLREDVR